MHTTNSVSSIVARYLNRGLRKNTSIFDSPNPLERVRRRTVSRRGETRFDRFLFAVTRREINRAARQKAGLVCDLPVVKVAA